MERTPWTSGTTSSTTSTPPSATLIWRSPPSQKQSGTSTTSTPSSAMLIWRLPLPSSPCPNSELIRTRWRWRQSHRRFRRAYIFDIWAERAFKFWITGVSTAGIPDRKEEAKFSEDNWGASTVGYIDSINKLSRRQFAHRGDRHWHRERAKRVVLVSP